MFKVLFKDNGGYEMSTLPRFKMEFEPATIEHLGLKLYVSLPPVIGELVSNAWDADAEKVEITLPKGQVTSGSEIIVKDDGHGMNANEVQEAYLRIGRNAREALKKDITELKGRPLMARKGLGKLSSFGIASELEVLTVKDGEAVCIKLNYEQMKTWPRGDPYEPEVVAERTGTTPELNGTEIWIRNLHRRREIDEALIRRELARRFTIIDEDFKVFVNGVQITYKDRRLQKDCKKAWDITELPDGNVIDASNDWKVSGWIGLVEKASQTERGVDIFARGKVVELETMFLLKTTHIQFARAYIVGEIHADFLDAEEDNISTARNSAQWESVAGQKLQYWGSKAVKYIFKQWLELQQKEKVNKYLKNEDFDKWLSTRTVREKKVALKLIKVIVEDQNIEPESAKPLLDVIKSNVEFQAFQELVDEIEDSGTNVKLFLKLFSDWRIIEAREHLKLSDGRLEVMENLSKCVKEGALEVKQIQPLFEDNGWLVNPAWAEVTGQTRYTKLLRKNCQESIKLDDKDRRIDILGYLVGGAVHVVELKRPEKTLSRDDLEQIERYVDWARTNLMGTGSNSPNYISGLLIVGKLNITVKEKMTRLAGSDIRVTTYDDLLECAKNIYGEVEERLKKIAPEYSREARRAHKRQSD